MDGAKNANNQNETIKELILLMKIQEENMATLARANEKHADNFTELLKQMKKTDAPLEGNAADADAS